MKLEEQAVEIAKREVLKKLASEEPYLFGDFGLYHRVKQFRNGTIQIQIRVKDGFVTDIVETEVKRYIFRKNEKTIVDNNLSDE